MKLPKYRIEELKRLEKHAKIVHKLYFELKKYLIDELELDINFVIDNINGLVNCDMNSDDFIKFLKEEMEGR